MFKTSVEVTNPGLLEAHVQILQKAPEVANTLINRTVNRERDRVLAQFRKEPGPATSPFIWKSEKQQRYVMMKLRKAGNLPYRRRSAPNRMVDQWRLLVVYQPGRLTSILLENDDPTERFVTGRDVQPGHVATGWYSSEDLIKRSQRLLTSKVETDLIKSFYAIEER